MTTVSFKSLSTYLIESKNSNPERIAIVDCDGTEYSYSDLDNLTTRVSQFLLNKSIGPGDRVGILLPKSVGSVAAVFGTLATCAAYVPVDCYSPISRAAYIFNDCKVKCIFVEKKLCSELSTELVALGSKNVVLVEIDSTGSATSVLSALCENTAIPLENHDLPTIKADDLAYILYTSGSTGLPKGVPLTHRNAVAFVDWCTALLEPNNEDRFSSHAPFHFDLSILDLYTSIRAGSTLILISEQLSKEPTELARYIELQRISIWYSAPSILTMMNQTSDLASLNLSALRTILFAGEVFPIKHLRKLMLAIPDVDYLNLYGPTETNVCTYERVPKDFALRNDTSLPIGRVCEHLDAMVVNTYGNAVSNSEEGELIIHGDNVMSGYWNLPDQTEKAFMTIDNKRFYRTGDVVTEDVNGKYLYLGRIDRMVKKRGYRIELGEIEAKLNLHPDILETAVIAVTGEDGVHIHAHFSTRNGTKISTIKLKVFCSENLPVYMIPDTFLSHDKLPKTSTDKTDYQSLNRLHEVEKCPD